MDFIYEQLEPLGNKYKQYLSFYPNIPSYSEIIGGALQGISAYDYGRDIFNYTFCYDGTTKAYKFKFLEALIGHKCAQKMLEEAIENLEDDAANKIIEYESEEQVETSYEDIEEFRFMGFGIPFYGHVGFPESIVIDCTNMTFAERWYRSWVLGLGRNYADRFKLKDIAVAKGLSIADANRAYKWHEGANQSVWWSPMSFSLKRRKFRVFRVNLKRENPGDIEEFNQGNSVVFNGLINNGDISFNMRTDLNEDDITSRRDQLESWASTDELSEALRRKILEAGEFYERSAFRVEEWSYPSWMNDDYVVVDCSWSIDYWGQLVLEYMNVIYFPHRVPTIPPSTPSTPSIETIDSSASTSTFPPPGYYLGNYRRDEWLQAISGTWFREGSWNEETEDWDETIDHQTGLVISIQAILHTQPVDYSEHANREIMDWDWNLFKRVDAVFG